MQVQEFHTITVGPLVTFVVHAWEHKHNATQTLGLSPNFSLHLPFSFLPVLFYFLKSIYYILYINNTNEIVCIIIILLVLVIVAAGALLVGVVARVVTCIFP